MKWKETSDALWLPVKACFDLTTAERFFLMGLLFLFCIGLGARWIHQRVDRPNLYTPPQEQLAP